MLSVPHGSSSVSSGEPARRIVARTVSGSNPRRIRNIPTRWRARGSAGKGLPRRWRVERIASSLGLGARKRSILRDPLGRGVIGAVGLDDIAADAVLTELRLDHAHAARRVAVTLLAPPAGEGSIIEVSELSEAIEGRHERGLLHSGASQASFELPARPRAGAEEPGRDLHGGLRTRWRRGSLGARTAAGGRAVSHRSMLVDGDLQGSVSAASSR